MSNMKEKFEKVCTIKDKALCLVEEQITGDISSVNAKELGEVMDIAKDAAELMKYCTEAEYYYKVVESMNKSSDEEKSYYLNKYIPEYGGKFYTPYVYNPNMNDNYYEDYDKYKSRMYYDKPNTRDVKEGRSGITRKTYMDMKNKGSSKEAKMHELEMYLKDLAEDITEMVSGTDSEEKTVIKQKLATLASKIG